MDQHSAISTLKGVGEKTSLSFEEMGVYTVGDILLYFPRTYGKHPRITNLPTTEEFKEGIYAICLQVMKAPVTLKFGGKTMTKLMTTFQDKSLSILWFHAPYMAKQIEPGKFYVFEGMIKQNGGNKLTMSQPKKYLPEEYKKIEDSYYPIYPLMAKTSGKKPVTVNTLSNTIAKALEQKECLMGMEFLSEDVLERQELCSMAYALEQIHFPTSMEHLVVARKRLVFNEFYRFLYQLKQQKEKKNIIPNAFTFMDTAIVDDLIGKLPYALTNAQNKTLQEILAHMQSTTTMQRLVQGDVGSGKTIIAFLSMVWVAMSGYQSAIMAPTEVLAMQHYRNFCDLCSKYQLDLPIILLTGALTAKEKRIARKRIEETPNAMIVGTHALIQEQTNFMNLAYVITDEQHRFGVHQRDNFSSKGKECQPHILVMSATPIPRTLALILYGDMDISVIDEVPARRLPIKNCVVGQNYRPTAYKFMSEQIALGHQAYVICPLVEETEGMEGENVIDYCKKLQDVFPSEIQIAFLHGKMKNEEKNKIMQQFQRNEIQILVSTTVVEVGVDVPNATVIMIEDAHRFGLAQLHQLRGRVGRGDSQSYCIMINGSNSSKSVKRLETLNHSNDGFYIASEDLRLRGPGDFFGIRQSGELCFSLADIYQDASLLKAAQEEILRLEEVSSNVMLKNPLIM